MSLTCFLTDPKPLLLSYTVFQELICALDVKNNEIFLSWGLDLGQSKIKKLRKLYHAIIDLQIRNFEEIWSNCLSLIIIYKNHEALYFFLSCFYFIWNISESLINEFSVACILKNIYCCEPLRFLRPVAGAHLTSNAFVTLLVFPWSPRVIR